MKIIFTLLLLVTFFHSANSQQWKMTTAYSLAVPRQEMGKNIQPAHSLQAGILYRMPGKLKQLYLGVEIGLGSYASKRIDQTFQFSNNVASIVPVNYNSNVFNANIQARLNLVNNKNYVIPYINAKGGLYNFFSNIHIDDPQDPDGCTALQHENIINDKTMYWSAGGGLQINPIIFSRNKNAGRVMIDISANTIHGGTMDYINTKHLVDEGTIPTGGKPLNVKFINASTQEIHEHKVAQVYTSPLRMLEFRLGVTIAFN
jgi:hypothetical protein